MLAPARAAIFQKALGFFFWTAVFGLSYTQAPLYYSNQNQYFLHGLAQSGPGSLEGDWLANTRDPTPVFSALVFLTCRFLHKNLFYLYYLLILGVYFQALAGVFSWLTAKGRCSLPGLLFLSLFVVLHSGLARWGSASLFGIDYPWYFQAGVAAQYILGFGLQPSVFGVFLVFSVYAFLRGRPLLAATCSSLTAVVHATYLLTAAFLTLSYLFVLFRSGRPKMAWLVGAWALALVLPVVAYNLFSFAPSSAEAFTEAQQLLVHFRLPHHAVMERWCDGIALGQVGWIVAALFLVRGQPLFHLLLWPLVFSFFLSLIQVGSGNDTLALLFPWRTSALLVPLATSVILARLVGRLTPALERCFPRADWKIKAAFGLPMLVTGMGGIAIMVLGLGYRSNPAEIPLLEFVRHHHRPGEVYLIPVEIPKLAGGRRGAISTNFTPPPRTGRNAHLISVDLQGFRLFTGAPIFVDFKSIPYWDEEVLQWHARLTQVPGFYRYLSEQKKVPQIFGNLGISHVVASAEQDLRVSGLEKIYEDAAYKLYRTLTSPAP